MGTASGAAATTRALELAYRYLNRRERTVSEVRRHLASRAVDDPAIQETIDTLLDQRYLDDERYVRLFVEDKRRLEGWGRERIMRALGERGIDPEQITAAFKGDQTNEELERALDLLRRRFPSAPQTRRDRDRAPDVDGQTFRSEGPSARKCPPQGKQCQESERQVGVEHGPPRIRVGQEAAHDGPQNASAAADGLAQDISGSQDHPMISRYLPMCIVEWFQRSLAWHHARANQPLQIGLSTALSQQRVGVGVTIRLHQPALASSVILMVEALTGNLSSLDQNIIT